MANLRLSALISGLFGLGLLFCLLLKCAQDTRPVDAFKSLDRALREQQYPLDSFNLALLEEIREQAEAYVNEMNSKYYSMGVSALNRCADYQAALDSLKRQIIERAGGQDASDPWMAANPGYVRSPGAWLASETEKVQPLRELARRTSEYWAGLEEIREYSEFESQRAFSFDYFGEGRFQIDRYTGNIKELPVAGMLACLSDLQNRARQMTNLVLYYCLRQVSAPYCGFDAYEPAISAFGSFVQQGEVYSTEIFLSAYETSGPAYLLIDGQPVPVRDGTAHYRIPASGFGKHEFTVQARMCGKTRAGWGYRDTCSAEVTRTFSYFVGTGIPLVEQQNRQPFLYTGVDNPISLHLYDGLQADRLKISTKQADIQKDSTAHYYLKPYRPGQVDLKIRIDKNTHFTYRYEARPLPDPQALLNDTICGGWVSSDAPAGWHSLQARYPADFEFDARCTVEAFECTRLRPRADAETSGNTGSAFSDAIRQLLAGLQPGDRVLFSGVRVRCPGDAEAREIGGLVFRVR